MKPGVLATTCLAVLLVLSANLAGAQTLTEQLIADDPVKLAEEARAVGNVVRGAILFHQGNTNCAKCHRPSAERDRFGPDLSRMEQDATDLHLIESILQPSKVIKKGFETTVILDTEGRVHNGMVLSEDARQVVIRDSRNPDQTMTFRRDEIEEMKPGNVSGMPENLANELKDREHFLDLLRYVIEIRERGPEPAAVATVAAGRREPDPGLAGLVLFQTLNCVACHGTGPLPASVKPKQAPRLDWSANRLNPEWMERFVSHPHAVKPGTTMPEVLGHLDEETRAGTARAITHYLTARKGNQYQYEAPDAGAVARGHELFNSVGCVACHAPRNEQAGEQPLPGSTPLGELESKYDVSGLTEFLENPLLVRPSGHMPSLQLTHREATDIAHFLLQRSTAAPAPWQPDPELARQGESLFVRSNCHSCHLDLVAETTPRPLPPAVGQWNTASGCLSGAAGEWPDFHLPADQRELILAALARPLTELTGEQQIEVNLQAFDCLACHERNHLGGVTAERSPHFRTANLNLGEQGRLPPGLSGVGAKLKPEWMRQVLVNGRSIRPYMKTRMPQFGEENVGQLIDLFQAADQLPATRFAAAGNAEEMRRTGLELAGNNGLNCVSCHTWQYKLSDTMPAVDLTEMAERLEKEWFYRYMLAPQAFSPNTVMPSFWPGGHAVRKDLAGTPEDQIEALWQYLLDGRQAAMPHGVVREPLEIVVADEARMLRRSYPGIGKRGIGVGYPGGVNLAFDAEQLRLHAIWKGKFVDPAGVWTGQGSGNVQPLGSTIQFIQGPDLDDRTQPWVVDEGRPPRHRFRGYVLDPGQRPTFRYTFDSIEVEDRFSEVINAPPETVILRRTVRLSAAEASGGLRFRLASGSVIAPDEDQGFAMDGRLTVRVTSGPAPEVVDDGGNGQRLQVPLELAPGQPLEMVIEYRWE